MTSPKGERKEGSSYHEPVLLPQSLEGLKIQSSGIYVDATFGGGGHSKPILSQLDDEGHLFAFDQDEDARRNVWDDSRLTFVQANFRFIARYMEYYGVESVDGILADLGVSSWQFDNWERGFSYRGDHLLDMRMNQKQSITAAQVLATYSANDLTRVFSDYGQVRNSKTLAQAISDGRRNNRLTTINDLLQIIGPSIRGSRMRYLSQVFQAIRIEVNDEMAALGEFLMRSVELLKPEGRLVVISYHSGEDKLVKKIMKTGNIDGIRKTDEFGHLINPLEQIIKKPVTPNEEEINRNVRARSAKLRIAEKRG